MWLDELIGGMLMAFLFSLAPHVGHLYSMVVADTLKRWQVLLGNEDAQLLTGTDEHGMKVLFINSSLEELVSDISNRYNELRSQRGWTHRRSAI